PNERRDEKIGYEEISDIPGLVGPSACASKGLQEDFDVVAGEKSVEADREEDLDCRDSGNQRVERLTHSRSSSQTHPRSAPERRATSPSPASSPRLRRRRGMRSSTTPIRPLCRPRARSGARSPRARSALACR